MPLLEMDASKAIEIRKSNPVAAWGNRASVNRVEPVAKPHFDVPFQIEPGEKIFTVGSCFARNVEAELIRRGFSLPMRDLFRTDAFQGLDPGVVNNFGTPSIYNEFAWALGARPFDENVHFYEAQPGKFTDLHVIPSIRPDRREVVAARRRAITEAYRSVLECRVLIMTLGLVEVWFDSASGYYLNAAPLPGMLRANPERFKLHVLSFEETYRHLEDALLLVKAKAHTDIKVILTVSPVPLALTHRPQDVMVANMYSKSVLRAVAETIVMRHDFVAYYPSYESVQISDRKFAWKDDLTHVTDEIVALNVDRMVNAYVRSENDPASLRTAIEAGGLTVAIEKAREIRKLSSEAADEFFAEYSHFSQASREFALEEAQHLAGLRRYDKAVNVLLVHADGEQGDQVIQLLSDYLLRAGRFQEAYDRLDPVLRAGNRSGTLWTLLIRAAQGLNDPDLVLSAANRWGQNSPKRVGRANALVARWFHQRGDLDRAVNHFRISMASDPDDVLMQIYYVEALLALGRPDEAVELYQRIRPGHPSEVTLHGRLGKSLGLLQA